MKHLYRHLAVFLAFARGLLKALLVASILALPIGATCHPTPNPDGGVTVSVWTDTARTILSAIGWAIPAARLVIVAILPASTATLINRVFDAVLDAANRLTVAVDTYTARGGDQCAAYAAAGGLEVAIIQAMQALADHGVALGLPLEQVARSLGSLVDNLVPACDRHDAGWASAGDRFELQLRLTERAANQRGVILRRDLDNIHP